MDKKQIKKKKSLLTCTRAYLWKYVTQMSKAKVLLESGLLQYLSHLQGSDKIKEKGPWLSKVAHGGEVNI